MLCYLWHWGLKSANILQHTASIVFSVKDFLEVATEGRPEKNLDPGPLNIIML